MASQRLIKKYPNRRLYDTVESRYVTLPHLRDLILRRIDLTIVDADSEADVTPGVLLQVMVDMELNEGARIDRNLLFRLIRAMARTRARTRRKKTGSGKTGRTRSR